jgi:hypothetical protein
VWHSEIAASRQVFAAILSLIARLWAPPARLHASDDKESGVPSKAGKSTRTSGEYLTLGNRFRGRRSIRPKPSCTGRQTFGRPRPHAGQTLPNGNPEETLRKGAEL